MRLLREYAQRGGYSVQLSLCEQYANLNFGGATQAEAIGAFKRVGSSQLCWHTNLLLQLIHTSSTQWPVYAVEQEELDKNGKMRYILVDWLVEGTTLSLAASSDPCVQLPI